MSGACGGEAGGEAGCTRRRRTEPAQGVGGRGGERAGGRGPARPRQRDRSEGGKAIAEALRGNGVLTNLSLYGNGIGEEGAKALASALRVNAVLAKLNLDGREPRGPFGERCVWRPCGSFSEVARACLECPHIERTKVAADSASALELSAREREKTCRGDGGR